MEIEPYIPLIIYSFCLILFLVLSAFFSGTETAFFSLNSLEREYLRNRVNTRSKKFLSRIFKSPDRILVTILTGNMVVNVFAADFFASTVTEEISKLFGVHIPEVAVIIIMTVLILIFGEMTPKNIAVRHPVAFGAFSLIPLSMTEKLLKPITLFLNNIRRKVMRRLSNRIAARESLKSELISLTIQIGFKQKMLSKYEVELFESYMQFREKMAGDIMIPRTSIKGIDISTSIEELIDLVRKGEVESAPYVYVYNKDMDHIAGYVDIKSLVAYKYRLKEGENLAAVIKPFYPVPETKMLRDLVQDLRKGNIEVAHVVDEYGGTAGVIPFASLIKEVFDYFYAAEELEIAEDASGWYTLPGSLEIGTMEEKFKLHFETENRTVAGLIIEHLGEIPESGRIVIIEGVEFKIERVSRNKIISLKMRYEE